jgi:hypothetical protein
MDVKIFLRRTRYAHWGIESGRNQVLKYTDRKRFPIEYRIVADSDDQFPIKNEWIRDSLHWPVKSGGMIMVQTEQPYCGDQGVLALPAGLEFMSRMARKRALELDWGNIAPEYEALYCEIAAKFNNRLITL